MKNLWNSSLRPVAVLLVICAAVGAVLAGVNTMTAPVIAANEARAANETYFAILPEADSFTQLSCDLEGVTAVLRADNGAGYVVTAQAQGYGGQVPAAVAFSQEGEVLQVMMMSNEETPGLGQKVLEEDFCGQFAGRSAQTILLEDIDAISGATISSKAALSAVNLAIEAYQLVTGGQTE